MAIERETIVERSEPETVVVDNGGGTGSGLVLGIIIVVLLIAIIGGVTVFAGGFSFGGKSVTVDVPKVTVTK